MGAFSGQLLIKDLTEKVTDLQGQVQNWKYHKASGYEKMKELERERDEARKEAFVAVGEMHNLQQKLEKASNSQKMMRWPQLRIVTRFACTIL